ncbi:MAG TPA: LysR substrate-binding domain-containing protein [Casimicrobiaceae bacterium]|nr:LysR substrate-binding domain-containing protein [Casimicrobiaceae bacterium]
MRLAQLRSFYATARYGGFTAGARQLHVSQPTVTSQVRALEESYGVELLHRHGHRLELTDAGRELFSIALRIFGLEEDAVHLLTDSGALRTGKLRIGAVGPYHVMEMIAAFRARYPGIEVTITVGNSEETVKSLKDYESDVAVLAQYAPDPLLHFVPYRSHPVVIFVPRGHRFDDRASLRLEELAGEPLVMREKGSTTRKALEDALRKRRIVPTISLEVGSREAVREAVIRGLGIAAVSEFEFVPDPRLRALAIAHADVRTSTHVVTLKERRHARVVAGFLAIVDELLRSARQRRPAA